MSSLHQFDAALRARRAINSLLGWHQHPRNGKIARLPEATRNQINQMLDDGLTYREIIQQLNLANSSTPQDSNISPLPYAISEMNLSNWYKGGFQDWRKRRLEAESQKRLGQKTAVAAPNLA